MEEVWKEIKRTYYYGGKLNSIYEISNFGRLRKNNNIINVKSNNSGYLLSNLGLIHRLVALAFIPNPENKPCVGHKDCNRLNNNVDNLYWCTYIENNNHPITKERHSRAMMGNQYFKDKHHSEETRKSMSEKKRGKKRTTPIWNKGIHTHYPKESIESGIKKRKEKWEQKTEEEKQITKNKISLANKNNTYAKGRIHINNGIISKMVYPEELEYYLSNGFVKGRLKAGK